MSCQMDQGFSNLPVLPDHQLSCELACPLRCPAKPQFAPSRVALPAAFAGAARPAPQASRLRSSHTSFGFSDSQRRARRARGEHRATRRPRVPHGTVQLSSPVLDWEKIPQLFCRLRCRTTTLRLRNIAYAAPTRSVQGAATSANPESYGAVQLAEPGRCGMLPRSRSTRDAPRAAQRPGLAADMH